MRPRASRLRAAWAAAAAYFLITLVMTWPLGRGLARDVPSDLGDPLLNMWILAWDAEQLRAILSGDVARVATFFDANIFHPAPLSLAYSEHLFAQALQILPVYLATHNSILCYNLVFLSTFVLSGLGGFLLVRELTGSDRAGFVAGLLFAFAPYRWTHLSHIQVLSAQWMPFALHGVRRYFDTGRRRPLIGAAVALTLQNLSCGYYLAYFTPFVVLYALWEIGTRRLWKTWRIWTDLLASAFGVLAITLPFLVPYKQARETLQMTRDLTEIINYSADVYSYFTAFDANRIWADAVSAYPKPEGALFPGLVPLTLAAVAVIACTATAWKATAAQSARAPRWIASAFVVVGAAYAIAAAAAIFMRRLDLDVAFVSIRATNVTRLMVPPLAAAAALAWLSPSWRARLAAAARQPAAIFAVILVLSWWLSLGPAPRVLGRALGLWSPYRLLYDVVPGFDGLRAPARFAMIVTFALSVLGGLAVARLGRRTASTIVVAALSVAFLVETQIVPLSVNELGSLRDYAAPERRVYRPERAPAVYRELARVDEDAVVLEMPLGEPTYDVLAVYYSTVHWRRLVNGYSGYFPPHYAGLRAVLSDVTRTEGVAGQALAALQVTHVVVHEAAYLGDGGARVTNWLREQGAVEIFRDGRDILFARPQ